MRRVCVIAGCGILAFAGCGSRPSNGSNRTGGTGPLSDVALTGTVYGGQQTLAGAHVYLFAAGSTGYGQASVSLLSAQQTGKSDSVGAYVTTGSNGSFSLTGDYSC